MASGKRGVGAKRGILICAALALVLAAFFYFGNNFSVVRVIQVSGVSEQEAHLVAGASGILSGMRLADVDADAVRRNLGARGEWEYLRMETQRPSTVAIYVRKRAASALVRYAGNSLVIDERGQVMENRSDDPDYDLIEVRGMEILGANVGEEVLTSDKNQILAVARVLAALRETGGYGRIRELNAKDLDNLYMFTADGIRVELGDSASLTAKCNWMIGVLDSLAAEGKTEGVVDVSTGSSAVYRP